MLIAVICIAWLCLGLPVAVLVGRALHHADAADPRRSTDSPVLLHGGRSAAGSATAR